MAQRPNPPQGMRDFGASDIYQRQFVQNWIVRTYEQHGFSPVETPIVESLERLRTGDTGENAKLVYEVSHQKKADADLGLRYDLTVPLSRYFATHSGEMELPAKVYQIGPVFRPERPQAGRYRQFTQCDIDVIGDNTQLAELEVVVAAMSAIEAAGVRGCTVRISDRRLLDSVLTAAGYASDTQPAVLVALDKLEKIGPNAVIAVLSALDDMATRTLVDRYIDFATEPPRLVLRSAAIEQARNVLEDLVRLERLLRDAGISATFDLSLVRGQGYYTGTIVEVSHPDVPGSVAGGGRYDEMNALPTVGMSIGFERLVKLVSPLWASPDNVALMFDADDLVEDVYRAAKGLRSQGHTVVRTVPQRRNASAQRAGLEAEGFKVFTTVKDWLANG